MMYPYLTLNDDTEITHSEVRPDGRVKVYIETPDEKDGFHDATCYLPVYGEIDVIKSERKSTIQTEPAARSRNIVETQGFCYNGGEHLTIEKEAGAYAHQLSAAMGHPKGARHEERGLAAGRRSYHQHDRQHGKGRAYQHENAAAYQRDEAPELGRRGNSGPA